ncbi:Zeaxanthin glucosyltransferase [Kordia antarctica]|uniref:Zeaxanthin glucosyltransferase n=1 Tax=Kordia antarctica TaxID=1218801 RepID=A0A7L4ZKA5_9FLAO|nr:glycosyltransferase [Kordia antarctica]QHI36897.1 Zeaxanthin glucosyltransferase [Kordia antarctica]
MARIGIIAPPTLGHVNPLLILGKELLKKGHTVVFFQLEEMKHHILDAGIEFHKIGRLIPSDTMKNMKEQLGQLSGIDAMRYWRKRQTGLFKIWFTELPGAIEKEKINFLLVDQSDATGSTIAEAKKIPYVTVCMGLDMDWEKNIPPFFSVRSYDTSPIVLRGNKMAMDEFVKDFDPLFKSINDQREKYGLPVYDPYRNMYPVSPFAQIAQMPSFLDYPRVEKPDYFYNVGPFIDDNPTPIPFPFEKLNGKPLVYISLGTILNLRPDIFNLVGASFKGIEVQLAISLGNKDVDLTLDEFPPETIIVSYAPQKEVLAKAKLCITHGGMNTVMDALSNAVPVLVVPISFDQPGTAGRMKYLNVGEYIQYKALSEVAINKTVKKIFSTNSYYENAAKMKEKFLQLNGRDQAINIIERTINEHV